jgi:arginase
MRRTVVLDAPSNLGLRPPAEGAVPGCYKLAGALRDQRLLARLDATDAGVVTAPRYSIAGWKPGDGVFHGAALAGYTRRLADRIGKHVDAGEFPVVLGGDCSILLGAALALRRLGRYGVAYLDGHSDYRHIGNAPHVGAAAGEGAALLTGLGQPDITDLDGLAPYVRGEDLAVLGVRDDDEALDEVRETGIDIRTVEDLRSTGAAAAAQQARARLEQLDGYWVHLDADILDPAVMPAVDSPDPGGIGHGELVALLQVLTGSPRSVGIDVAIFDPDLDPDGSLAAAFADTLVAGLR